MAPPHKQRSRSPGEVRRLRATSDVSHPLSSNSRSTDQVDLGDIARFAKSLGAADREVHAIERLNHQRDAAMISWAARGGHQLDFVFSARKLLTRSQKREVRQIKRTLDRGDEPSREQREILKRLGALVRDARWSFARGRT
jgi:hypothetical protein